MTDGLRDEMIIVGTANAQIGTDETTTDERNTEAPMTDHTIKMMVTDDNTLRTTLRTGDTREIIEDEDISAITTATITISDAEMPNQLLRTRHSDELNLETKNYDRKQTEKLLT